MTEQAVVSKNAKSLEALAHINNLREMEKGIVQGDRLKEDPQGAIDQLAEYASFAADALRGEFASDWKSVIKAKIVRAVDLAALIDAPIPYIVKPIIVEGSLTQIQGIQKGGKSAFSLLLSLCLATGTWPFPQYLAAAEPVEVLYLAWEDPEIMMAKRLSLYAAGLGFDRTFMPEKLTFLFGPDLFVEREDHDLALRAAIAELKPKVIFIDTLSHIHLCDENAASEMKIPMKNLARIAQDCGVGIVYLHHTGKGSSEKIAQDKSRGSGAIAAAWHVLIDWGQRDKGSNINPVEVQSKYEHEWKNWAIAYEPVKDDVGQVVAVRWTIDTPSGDDSRNGKVDSRRTRIIETMKRVGPGFADGWMTAQDLVETTGLGVDSKTIKRYLQPLCEEGAVQFREGSNSKDGKTPNSYRLVGGNLV